MKFSFYDSQGKKLTSGSTIAVGGTSPAAGTQPMATYDRMDVGILALQQTMQAFDVYDFRVPGDPNRRTFQYKFPRNGFVLGVSLTGTLGGVTTPASIYTTKTDGQTGMTTDVMGPDDAGNTVTYDATDFPAKGKIILAPSPIPYAAGDLAQMKFKSQYNSQMTVNLAGFLIIGLSPQ